MSSERGSVGVTFSLALAAFATLGIGTALLVQRWHSITQHQLRLDRCVARSSLELRDLQNRVESLNSKIRAARIAAAVTTIQPQVRAALIATIEALALAQDGFLLKWRIAQGRWLIGSCEGSGDFPTPLPDPGWLRGPPDMFGPRELSRAPDAPNRMRVEIRHGPRASSAEVSKEESRDLDWHARWIPARSNLFGKRAGIR